ncbi:hypothetical protein ACWCRD_16220 [Streptomyces sp. NPDC002092]
MTSPTRLLYDERLTAPRAWWLIAVLFGRVIGTPYPRLVTRTPERLAEALG